MSWDGSDSALNERSLSFRRLIIKCFTSKTNSSNSKEFSESTSNT